MVARIANRDVGRITLKSGGYLWVDPEDRGLTPALVLFGEYEPGVTRVLGDFLRPGNIFVDVGANIGYYSVLAGRLVGNQGSVLAFEPNPRTFTLLERNIRENGLSNVMPIQLAVGELRGQADLYLDLHNQGNSSLGSRNVSTPDVRVTVSMDSLDECLLRSTGAILADVVKIDTQGAEMAILAGGRRTMRQRGIKVILECWPKGLAGLGVSTYQFFSELHDLHFDVQLIEEPSGHLVPASLDLIRRLDEMGGGFWHGNLLCTRLED